MAKIEINGKLYYTLVFIIGFVMLASLANAFDDLGYARTNTNYNIVLGCSYNNSYCPVDVSCNITFQSPTKIIINNKLMDNSSFPQYNYTVLASNLTENGLYYGRQVCCGGIGCSNDYSFQIHLNAQGKDNSNDGTTYAVIFFLLVGLFVFSVYSFTRIQGDNQRNEYGEIVGINYRKYLKIGSFTLAYILLIGISYFAWNISYGVLQFTEMANFFYAFFRILVLSLLVFIPILFVFTIARLIKDRDIYVKILRGVTAK